MFKFSPYFLRDKAQNIGEQSPKNRGIKYIFNHSVTFLYNGVVKCIIKTNGGGGKHILPVDTALTMSERLFHEVLAAPAPLGE